MDNARIVAGLSSDNECICDMQTHRTSVFDVRETGIYQGTEHTQNGGLRCN